MTILLKDEYKNYTNMVVKGADYDDNGTYYDSGGKILFNDTGVPYITKRVTIVVTIDNTPDTGAFERKDITTDTDLMFRPQNFSENQITSGVPTEEPLEAAMRAEFFKIGGIRYEKKTGTAKITVNASKKYTWSYYRVNKDDEIIDKTGKRTVRTSFTYEVPFSYYKLTNLNIYKIDKYTFTDGFTPITALFDTFGMQRTEYTTSSYKNRFSNFETQLYGQYLGVYNSYDSNFKWGSGNSPSFTINQKFDDYLGDYGEDGRPDDDEFIEVSESELYPVDIRVRNDKLVIDGKTVTDGDYASYTLTDGNVGSVETYEPRPFDYSYAKSLTGYNDFQNTKYQIPWNRINGKRVLSGDITYKLISSSDGFGKGNGLSVGSSSFVDSFDNEQSVNSILTGYASEDMSESKKALPSGYVDRVTVLAPITANYVYTPPTKEEIIDQRVDKDTLIAQRGSILEIKPTAMNVSQLNIDGEYIARNKVNSIYSGKIGNNDYRKYVKKYAMKFTFKLENANLPMGDNGWYMFNEGQTLRATISNDNPDLLLLQNKFWVATLAKNSTLNEGVFNSSWLSWVESEMPSRRLGYTQYNSNSTKGINPYMNIYNTPTRDEARYITYEEYKMDTLGRLYNFRITDISDLDWKNVFRKNATNEHTGYAYYSGNKYWDESSLNNMNDRGLPNSQLLPVGAKSNKDPNYIAAPKLGYRFSFDLKTTGSLTNKNKDNQRRVEIEPRFMYISKDGKTVKDIDLYYKNSSNRYVKVGSSSDRYNIYMRPNDNSRLLLVGDNAGTFSSGIYTIGTINKLVLKNQAMTLFNEEGSNKEFIQNWYGEYKLPNTTIALEKGATDLNNPLTDGYIAVMFNIWTVETASNGSERKHLMYGTDTSSTDNSTQWDKEGYKKTIPLEKGVMNLDTNGYYMGKDFKGFVFMYDIDARASSDFDTGGTR